MKKSLIILFLGTACVVGSISLGRLKAADGAAAQSFEYATIRWNGREGAQLIRPGMTVELLDPQWARIKKPDNAVEQSFYMNVEMNVLAKEGYEFAGMTTDEILMKRAIRRP